MCNNRAWLPPMAQVSPWQHGGDNDTHEMLYGIFCQDFVGPRPRYAGYQVWYYPDMEDGKEKIFWHLTSREEKAKPVPRRMRHIVGAAQQPAQRLPDLRRSERLPWVRPLIENATQPVVLAWDYQEGNGEVHTYVWLKDSDFVVIMKKYPDGRRRLITSYYVDKGYKRQDFERKYAKRLQ